ncbi:unnamed protein product [Blumeria hordei]|uniref:RecQ-mediated genome instability protein 1 n=2 Tax=Blumeria hordei TaxID=2867405 RepID=A0A383UWW7_BLUHO|nr:RecQ mediated genome instability protein Rmi1 [Blumeria hordei DH14]SZF03792.1 unnamed protein product [Blumeria hordei]
MATTASLSQLIPLLASQSLPVLHHDFLTAILATSSRSQPIVALAATVKHRLLSSDISGHTSPVLATTCPGLPSNLGDRHVQTSTLHHDVFVQVLDLHDIGRSTGDQIDLLEAERKGETKKGREIIRIVPDAEQEPATAATQSLDAPTTDQKKEKGPFRLVLQDSKGNRALAYEIKRVNNIGYPSTMSIGCKLWLRKGCKVARGVLLLEPTTVGIIGGRIETMDREWRTQREDRLRSSLQGLKTVAQEVENVSGRQQ